MDKGDKINRRVIQASPEMKQIDQPVFNGVRCMRCKRNLAFLQCYIHPTYGKKHFLCSRCFDIVYKSVAEWMRFIEENSFVAQNQKQKPNWKRFIIVFIQWIIDHGRQLNGI